MAQPPGIVYSTTVPYTGMPAVTGFNLYPNPTVLLATTDAARAMFPARETSL